MKPILPVRTFRLVALALLGIVMPAPQIVAADSTALRQALSFYASFDNGLEADFASGDPKLYWAPSMKQPRVGQPGLPTNNVVTIEQGQGRFGNALRFRKKGPHVVFFSADRNVAYRERDWSGTVSFWLKVSPSDDLEPGYCDPIQITPRDWNDAAFFVEFEKKKDSIPFRLGAYADFKVWNPRNRDWNTIPADEKPLLTLEKPPFTGERWTHVAFTFSNFNTGRADGIATLYLNGERQGEVSSRQQTFTWDPSKALVMLGLSYIGLWDELAIFNRALTPDEIGLLHRLDRGLPAQR